jgi:hypothetical protein
MRRNSRRKVLIGALSALAAAAPRAFAGTTCMPGTRTCRSELSFSGFAAKYEPQYQSQWCWAACISMVFNYYGRRVSQERIVREVYGAPANIPALPIVISQQLSRSWTTDDGRRFRSRLRGVYDSSAGVAGLQNVQIFAELDAERPLIIGARGHAVVITSCDFLATQPQPTFISFGGFDPWPGRGARSLQQDEVTPREWGGSLVFVAAFELMDS